MSRLDSKPKAASATTTGGDRFHVRFGSDYLPLLRRAARGRDISMSGYIRRAVGIQIAKDLGMSPLEVIGTSSYPAAYGKKYPPYPYCPWRADADGNEHYVPNDERVLLPDDGAGYGDWEW